MARKPSPKGVFIRRYGSSRFHAFFPSNPLEPFTFPNFLKLPVRLPVNHAHTRNASFFSQSNMDNLKNNLIGETDEMEALYWLHQCRATMKWWKQRNLSQYPQRTKHIVPQSHLRFG